MVQQRILPPAEPLSDDPASIHRKTAMRPLPSQRMRVTGTFYGVAPGPVDWCHSGIDEHAHTSLLRSTHQAGD